MDIQLVIFDLGYVLIRIHPHWQSAAQAVGFDLTDEHDVGMARYRERMTQLSHDFECGRIDEDHFVTQVAETLSLPREVVADVTDEWIIEPYADALQLVHDVKQTGRLVACLSNTNANHWAQMSDPTHRKYVGTGVMDWAFASQELQCRKPEIEVYEKVEAITGVKPQHMLFFDDIAENLEPARSRGWNTFLVDRSTEPGPQVRGYLKQVGVLAS